MSRKDELEQLASECMAISREHLHAWMGRGHPLHGEREKYLAVLQRARYPSRQPWHGETWVERWETPLACAVLAGLFYLGVQVARWVWSVAAWCAGA